MKIGKIEVPEAGLRALCGKWRIRRLAVFGSVLTPDFGPDSDIDLPVEFEPGEQWSLMDLVRAERDFAGLLGRRVELVERASLERSRNWIRRNSILSSAEVVLAT